MAGAFKLLAVVLGLLAMVPDTMQLSVDHPLHTAVESLNSNAGPFLGLVISSSRDEKILKNSTFYEADTATPYITISGRRFNFGKFKGVSSIYVLAGAPLANVGVTVQILLDTFRIKGIINFGGAATVSNKVFIADVVIPSQVAYTSVVKWEKYNGVVVAPSLVFGDYNVPQAGQNYLQHIEFQKTKAYTPTSSKKSTFFFNVYSEWVQHASSINYGDSLTVHVGEAYKVGSSDIYVANAAYATYLNKALNITAVDTESAAVVTTAIANGVPHIVFRGTSNRPGSESNSRLLEVTAKNVLKTVAAFVDSYFRSGYTSVY